LVGGSKFRPFSRHIMARFSRENLGIAEKGEIFEAIIARDIVQTLYELLGALPDDDADGLRAAFRKAVKASHPDNNSDDPDAPQRFRRIVRAHVILSDGRQRAAYDSLLTKAHQQRALNSKRNLVPDVISSMVAAFVSIGAFLLFERVLTIPIVPAQVQDISARASALTAAMPTLSSDTTRPVGEHNKPDKTLVSNDPEVTDAVKKTTVSAAVAAASNAGDIPTTSEAVVKDAKYYRQRGSQAYRSGDLALALIDFDFAIALDPKFSDAYIDRAIVFHRMGDMKSAFADVTRAKHIDGLKPPR
jgi:tetratricopeptide (TPR) repeat protein